MTAAAALTKTEDVISVPIADIRPSTVPNYRKRVSQQKLNEMAASMLEAGVLEPVVLRPQGTGLELVFGQQRVTAATLAELANVPAIVRHYSDDQVRQARLIENEGRSDVHPLDQAEEYSDLVKRGVTAQQLSEKLGQPLRYVLERLALNSLCKAAREALEQEHISLGVAIELAKLPSQKVQETALERVVDEYDERQMSVKEARAEIESGVMLKLGDAPFKLDDATLVPKAGPCTTCTKRTGNQGDLFPNASSADLCLDPICHTGKLEAVWQLRVKTAKQDGVNVLSAKESAAALTRASAWSSGEYIRVDEKVDVGNKSKSVKSLLGKAIPQLTLARDDRTGLTVELVPRKLVDAAARAAAPGKGKPEAATVSSKAKAEREAELVQGEVRRRTMHLLVSAMDARCKTGVPSRPLLRLLVRGALESVWTDIAKRVADRRGLPQVDEEATSPKKGAKRQLPRLTANERIDRLLPDLDEGQLLALLLELVMGRAAPGKWSEGAECYVDACAELGVVPKVIEANVKSERKAKVDAKTAKAAPAAKTKAKPKAKPKATAEAPLPPAQKKAAKKAAPKPEHPATGQVVHFVDPTGLSQTGVSCGGKVGGSRGIVSDDSTKVTCKSCRRTAKLDYGPDETAGAEDSDDPNADGDE